MEQEEAKREQAQRRVVAGGGYEDEDEDFLDELAEDFKNFSKSPMMLFEPDLPNLYRQP